MNAQNKSKKSKELTPELQEAINQEAAAMARASDAKMPSAPNPKALEDEDGSLESVVSYGIVEVGKKGWCCVRLVSQGMKVLAVDILEGPSKEKRHAERALKIGIAKELF